MVVFEQGAPQRRSYGDKDERAEKRKKNAFPVKQ
jgi:hypothetical protein